MQHAGGRASARMRLHQLAIVALAALLEWALVGGTRSVVGAEPPLAITFGTQAPLPLGVASGGRLDGPLREFASAPTRLGPAARDADLAAAVPAARAAVSGRALRLDRDSVQVEVEWAGAVPPHVALAAFGARIEHEDRAARVVQARVPAAALESLAAAGGVRHVRLPRDTHV
ncbi:MAG: hypothetical protein FJ035_09100, partial [Chloroflexi bacterium]|nr:hypothetical protein [Chloroflexota bacterium]